MDFELKNLEMIENSTNMTSSTTISSVSPEVIKTQSLILNELQKENEELQNKLKLNYRRLLLFEAENNKLVEEKNKHFFEAQNQIEKAQILVEKNKELELENEEFDSKLQLLNEKIYTYEKINKAQLIEIQRFSKFHLKIQNVVKPYIVQLKSQLATARKELKAALNELELFKRINQDLEKANTDLTEQRDSEAKIYQIDKNALINSYEEQIHSFSKEILNQQTQNEGLQKEIARLKKSVEFKNYFENEVIKFKRIHEEDQYKIQQITAQKNELETQIMGKSETLAEIKIELSRISNQLDEKESLLEVTRKQLAKQLDESVLLNERLNRLEKLNNQLSREMSQSN
jgi:hypothetical protein